LASKITGSPLAHRYKVENEFDIQYGDVFVEYWNGPKIPIETLATAYKLAGARVRTTHVGPKWEMVVRIGGFSTVPGGVETPVDQWSIDMEPAQVSVWSHPKVDARMALFANRALWRKDIEDAVKDGTVLPAPISSDATAQGIWRLLARGYDSYEIKRPVLTKTRTYSIAYTQRFVLDPTEKVFTTGALVAAMSIPAAVQAQLPATPVTVPEGCAWAWKVRTSRTQLIPTLGKIQETRDWLFDAWSVEQGGVFGFYEIV
jgi:hypothetical protein